MSSTPTGALFFLPFSFGPLLVNAAIGVFCRVRGAQIILVLAAVAYFGWFGWIYMSVVHWHPDPQGPIAFLFVGAYALPVLLPMWIAAAIVAVRSTNLPNKPVEATATSPKL
jgi:hypothetical protein